MHATILSQLCHQQEDNSNVVERFTEEHIDWIE